MTPNHNLDATMDLDGKRFIVMGIAGGTRGGYQYHLWLGPKTGRVKKAVAYIGPLAGGGSASVDMIDDSLETSEGSTSFLPSEIEEDQISGVEKGVYRYDNYRNAFDTTAPCLPAPSTFHMRQPNSSSKPSAQKKRLCGNQRLTKRARSRTPPGFFEAGHEIQPANVAGKASPPLRIAANDANQLSDARYDTPALTPSTNKPRSPAPESITLSIGALASLPTLTPYKQTHTTLRAARDSNVIGFVPLRLLSCMTMSALFSSVIAASGYRDAAELIQCLMAVFDWKEDNDVYKAIYIDKGTEGSFEIFLEIIDEAPCWKDEGGKCGIAVEIVRT